MAALAGQTGSISSTVIFTAPNAGLYTISVYLVCSTASSDSNTFNTVSTSITWTDEVQNQIWNVDNLICNLLGSYIAPSVKTIYIALGQTVSYSTSTNFSGNPSYDIFINVKAV